MIRRAAIGVDPVECRSQVDEESGGVVVALLQGHPGNSDRRIKLTGLRNPLDEQCGLAKPGRCGDKAQSSSRLHSRGQLVDETWTGDGLGARRRDEELRSQDHHRHCFILRRHGAGDQHPSSDGNRGDSALPPPIGRFGGSYLRGGHRAGSGSGCIVGVRRSRRSPRTRFARRPGAIDVLGLRSASGARASKP